MYLQFLRSNARFLAFGFTLTFFSSFGQTYFIGVFGGAFRETFDISHGVFGLCYMIATVTSAVLLLRVGRMIDSVDLRLYTGAVCLGVVAACFLMSAAGSIAMLTIALFALRFTGQGLMSHTSFTSMGRYFGSDRAKAMSIAGLGFSVGWAVFPGMADLLLDATSWQAAWRWLGIGAAVVVVPLALWLLRGHGRRHAAWHEDTVAGRSDLDSDESLVEKRHWTRAEVLRDKRFYLLIPAVLAPTFLITGFVFHQVHLAEAKGWSRGWIAGCSIAMAGAAALTTLVSGPLTDRFGPRRLVRLYLLPLGLSMLALALFRAPGSAVLYLMMAGVTTGAAAPVLGSLWIDIYGALHYGSIRAMTSSLMVLSTALAPFVMGQLIDWGLSIEAIAWMSLAYTGIGVGLIALAMRRPG